MFEQSDHIARSLSSVCKTHKENWLAVGKFYRAIHAKSSDFVRIVQYADSFAAKIAVILRRILVSDKIKRRQSALPLVKFQRPAARRR